jgi:inner membrane protein
MVIAADILLHPVLDTLAGGIRWLWPLSRAELVMTHVPARHEPWVLDFALHWSFALELAILAAALFIAGRTGWPRSRAAPAG